MPRPFEDELQVERESKSTLGQLDETFGRHEDAEAKVASAVLDRGNAPEDHGFGAGLLEEQRRARTWKLALGAIILVVLARMVFNVMTS